MSFITYLTRTFRSPSGHFNVTEAGLRAGGLLAVLSILAIGCWLLAQLAWAFLPPVAAPEIQRERRPQAIAEKLAQHLQFGHSATTAALPGPGQLMLVGTAASTLTGQARALLRREGERQLLVAAIGDEVLPGVRLEKIEQGQVTLSGKGVQQHLTLPKPTNALPDTTQHD